VEALEELEVVRETVLLCEEEGLSIEVVLMDTGNGVGRVRLVCEKTVATVERKPEVRDMLK
jgi:hypothetical protein